MRRFVLATALCGMLGSAFCVQEASAQSRATDYRRSMGNLRPDHPTAGPAVQGSYRYRLNQAPTLLLPTPQIPYTQPYYQPGYPYQYPSYGYPSYQYYRPMIVPGNMLYGPQAMRRFMGIR